MTSRTHTILLVEDSRDDAFFMEYALRKAGITHSLHLAPDGEAALEYLQGTGQYADRAAFPLPTVIFLDLKMPCLNGFEVLAWIRAQPALRHLPVFILTGSSEDRDRARARELGAEGYFVKPPNDAMLREIMEGLGSPAPAAPVITNC